MKAAALLFGLNYDATPSAGLRGCHQDARNVAAYLRGGLVGLTDIALYTDDVNYDRCTAKGIVRAIGRLATRSWSESLELAWIHFSGHGTSQADDDGDENDGRDECLCPADFMRAGLIVDDDLQELLRMFRPGCRVVMVCDCCHSGTIGDLPFMFGPGGFVEREADPAPGRECRAKVLLLSGCSDRQTSADACGVDVRNQFTGAMTSCLLGALRDAPELAGDALALLDALRKRLLARGFDQVPQLCASYDVAADRAFVPPAFVRARGVVSDRLAVRKGALEMLRARVEEEGWMSPAPPAATGDSPAPSDEDAPGSAPDTPYPSDQHGLFSDGPGDEA